MAAELVLFADFELDQGAYELRRKGRVVRLERIPLDLLLLLVERRGQLVTRDEIIERIWGKEVFLDTESSINTAIGKLRRALRDHRGSPRFIATVPAKGYRFIAEVHEPTFETVPIRHSLAAVPDDDCKLPESHDGPAGERRRLTVLFCDLMNSTGRVAQRDSEEWWEIVADHHRAAAQAIERYGGHVGQYRGDGVMAFFGRPEAHDNDAERAARAGLAILDVITKLNQERAHANLSARIGIDSGAVVVRAGAGKDADVFGDAPNIAACAKAAADPGEVLITAETHRLVSGLFVIEDRGSQVLKGIERPVQLYRVIQPSGVRGRFEAAAAAGGLTPFVGREDELRSLMSRWERSIEGEGQVALIIGEAGIGKSRLLRRFHEQLVGTPHLWVEAGAGAFFQNTPFYPVTQMLRQFLGDAPEQDHLAQIELRLTMAGLKPAGAIPLVAPLLNLPLPANYPQSTLSPEQQRRRLLATLVEWVLGSARAQPLVIATEDLHWADPSTLDLIQLLVEQGALAPMLLLYTARPQFHAPWPQRAHHTQITLNRLSQRNARTMVEAVAAHGALSEKTITTVVERAGGVPLFVEELTRSLLESGDARTAGREIPATLHDSLTARLDRLGAAKEIIQIGAVLGTEFSYEVLHAVHPIAEAELQHALGRLADAELVYVRGLAPDATYQFKHALIRDTAYEALLKSRRKELHRIVARTIDEQFPTLKETRPEVLARHWTEAGEIEPAIAAWTKAGKTAASRNAFHEALESYQQALALLNLMPESTERDSRELDIRQSVVSMLNITSGYAARETINAVERAIALAEKNGDLTQLFNLLTSRGSTLLISGDFSGAGAILDRALELTVRQSTPVNLAYLHVLQTIVRYYRGDLEDAERHFNAWSESFGERGAGQSIPVAVSGLAFGGLNAWVRGRADTARQRESQMIAIADRGSPFDIANSRYCAAQLEVYLRDYVRAEALAVRAVELGEKHQFPNPAARGRGILGLARAHLHRTAEGVALIQQCLAGLREIGTRMGITTRMSELAEAQGLEG